MSEHQRDPPGEASSKKTSRGRRPERPSKQAKKGDVPEATVATSIEAIVPNRKVEKGSAPPTRNATSAGHHEKGKSDFTEKVCAHITTSLL